MLLSSFTYDPVVHIEIGPLSISPHGIGIALGFLLGARLMLPAAERRGITEDDVYALLTRAAIGAIIGARVAYVINHFGDYDNPLEIFKIWEGGISLLGGFVGAVLLALPEMRKRGLSFWKVMDAAAPGMALGVIIGRLGDLVVADHLGKPTDFVLGYKCPPTGVETASPCVAGPGGVVFQPALIDFVLTMLLLGLLLRLRRSPRWDGFLIMVFTVCYGTFRIVEDFMRVDETHGTGLTGSQWTSVVFLVLTGAWLLFRRRTPRWGRWDERPAEERLAEEPEEPPTMAIPPEREE
ncbi:MAG: phosphatidylglycerol---prolipoprotein diacylglyceryl transferase [Actinomycetota bacterium]